MNRTRMNRTRMNRTRMWTNPWKPESSALAVMLLSAALVIGCGDPSDRTSAARPSGGDVLSDSLMIEVLADLHLVGAERYFTMRDNTVRDNSSHDSERDSTPDSLHEHSTDQLIRRLTADAPIDSLLGAHDVRRAAYDSSIDWYIDHPEEFVNLYNRVLDRLNQIQ